MTETRAKKEEEDEAGIKQHRKTKGNELSARYKTKNLFYSIYVVYSKRGKQTYKDKNLNPLLNTD